MEYLERKPCTDKAVAWVNGSPEATARNWVNEDCYQTPAPDTIDPGVSVLQFVPSHVPDGRPNLIESMNGH
jgi:hypothetical protein